MVDAPYLDTLPRCRHCGGVVYDSRAVTLAGKFIAILLHRSNKSEVCPGTSTGLFGGPTYAELSAREQS